jgi:LAO/AO transport system kinase
MQRHTLDDGVYVRSMATHGHLGGLSHATSDAVLVLDAAGRQIVLVETVGVGQGEVEIARTADVSIVVTTPEAGDEVQAMKAGVMEIADVFVVNKADRPGADRTASEIEGMLSLREFADDAWRPPVIEAQATTGEGVPAIVEAVQRFRHEHRDTAGRRRARAEFRLTELLRQAFVERLRADDGSRARLEHAVDRIADGAVDPYAAAAEIMEHLS